MFFLLETIQKTQKNPKNQKNNLNLKIDDKKLKEILKILNLESDPHREDYRKITLTLVSDPLNPKKTTGESRNLPRILGNFIHRSIKHLAKNSINSDKFHQILTKVSKTMNAFNQDQAFNEWRMRLNYKKLADWVESKPHIKSLESFQQIIGMKFANVPCFKELHFSCVLKRILKHMIIYEFSKYLITNSKNEKNKQDWRNAICYIEKLPRFLRAFKDPNILNSLND